MISNSQEAPECQYVFERNTRKISRKALHPLLSPKVTTTTEIRENTNTLCNWIIITESDCRAEHEHTQTGAELRNFLCYSMEQAKAFSIWKLSSQS